MSTLFTREKIKDWFTTNTETEEATEEEIDARVDILIDFGAFVIETIKRARTIAEGVTFEGHHIDLDLEFDPD